MATLEVGKRYLDEQGDEWEIVYKIPDPDGDFVGVHLFGDGRSLVEKFHEYGACYGDADWHLVVAPEAFTPPSGGGQLLEIEKAAQELFEFLEPGWRRIGSFPSPHEQKYSGLMSNLQKALQREPEND